MLRCRLMLSRHATERLTHRVVRVGRSLAAISSTLPKQDEDTTHVDEAQVVERMALLADDEAAKIAQPSKESLDLPAGARASERTAILSLGRHPPAVSTARRRDHLDAPPRQRPVEAIRVIGAIANQASWQLVRAHRDAYCNAIRAFHAAGKPARTWPLRYLIRHTAYHTLDHAWEMEDKDLTVGVR